MASLDTRETTVLLEKTDKVIAILASIQNHLEQKKPSEQKRHANLLLPNLKPAFFSLHDVREE